MKVYFTTVVRGAPIDKGGEVVAVDWSTKRILARRAIAPTDPPVVDPNPRGGARGGRGILLRDGRVYVASYHTIHAFDLSLTRELARISHPLFAGLHELAWDGDGIWATSTSIDAAVKVSAGGATLATWWPRDDPVTTSRFDLLPADIDKDRDQRQRTPEATDAGPGHVHLNAIAMFRGRPTALLNSYGAIVATCPTEILVVDQQLRGSHNLLPLGDDLLAVNNTLQQSIDLFDGAGRSFRRIDLTQFAPVKAVLRRSRTQRIRDWLSAHGRPRPLFARLFRNSGSARPVFVRGCAHTADGNLLVGISPAAILEIDWRQSRLIDFFTYSDDVRVAVHGLTSTDSS